MFYSISAYHKDLETAAGKCTGLDKLNNKSILITGASGLIGSFITDLLIYINENMHIAVNVYGLSRNEKSLAKRFQSHLGKDYFHIIEHDISKPIELQQRFDYIIHAASNAYPAAFVSDPVGTMLGNFLGVNYLLDYGRQYGTQRMLYVSSGEVYGQGGNGITSFDERYSGYVDPMSPRACYPSSKRASETLCVSYASQYNLDVVVARPCHIYGPCTTSTDNRATVQFVDNVLNGQDIVMKSPGLQLRSYCYVADCASAILAILLHGKTEEAYNVANSESEVTILKMAQIIAGIAGRKVVFEQPADAEKAGFNPVTQSVLNVSKLESIGWKAVYNMESGMRQTLDIRKAMATGSGL